MIAIALLQNVALIVLFTAVQQALSDGWLGRDGLGQRVVSGAAYGLTGVASMMAAFELADGYIFDGRSIVLTLAGVFGGPVSALVAMLMCAAYRLYLGGIGAPAGVFVIVSSAFLGVFLHVMDARTRLRLMRAAPLYGLSLLVHVVMLWGQVFFLGPVGLEAVKRIGPTVIVLFPIVTLLIAKLVLDLRRRTELGRELERRTQDLEDSLSSVIDVIGGMIETRDPYTATHQDRVCALALKIAEELGFTDADRRDLETAALLHDVGKIAVPTEILAKPGALSTLERRVVREHVAIGSKIIERANLGASVAAAVAEHHERCDGSGYPRGLTMGEIGRLAKVLMVADVVEAMCSHRPWRAQLGVEAALTEIRTGAGVLYDPVVCDACLRVFERGFAFTGGPGVVSSAATG